MCNPYCKNFSSNVAGSKMTIPFFFLHYHNNTVCGNVHLQDACSFLKPVPPSTARVQTWQEYSQGFSERKMRLAFCLSFDTAMEVQGVYMCNSWKSCLGYPHHTLLRIVANSSSHTQELHLHTAASQHCAVVCQ